MESPLNKIEKAHEMYRDGRHEAALDLYTEALSMAKTKPQKIALHSNRAACYLKLHNFNKAAEECTLVLELDQNHTGALMLRAQTLVTLKEYHSALFDVNRLMELNSSSDVYQNLQARLKTQLSLTPILECEEESVVLDIEEDEVENEEENSETEEKEEEVEKEEGGQQEQQQTVAILNQKIEVPRTLPIPQIPVSSQKPQQQQQQQQHQQQPAITYPKQKTEVPKTLPIHQIPVYSQTQKQNSSDLHSKGYKEIPKPKGHAKLDYSRWDRVEDDSSEEDEDEDEESLPQYRFRVRTVGVRPVK